MYRLYPIGSIPHNKDALWLHYEWGDSFDNHEWRPCVEHFLGQIAELGRSVVPLPAPPFTPGEDFIQLDYLVDGAKATFSSDHLLSLITITSEEPSVFHAAWKTVGDKVGWEH